MRRGCAGYPEESGGYHKNCRQSPSSSGNAPEVPFDAVLTTNYTYEAEQILSGGRWSESARNKAFTALDGNAKVGHNSFICNAVKTLEAMEAVATYVPAKDGNYEEHYETIIARIQDEFMKRE